MENLLRSYRALEGAIEAIKHELNELNEKGVDEHDLDDTIAGMILKRTPIDEVKAHGGNHVSDKTANIAIDYRDKMKQENQELSMQLQEELFILQLVLDKLDIGLRALPEETRKVIEIKYFDNLAWFQVEMKLPLSKHQAQDMRKSGIDMLRAISRIRVEEYEKAMKLLSL